MLPTRLLSRCRPRCRANPLKTLYLGGTTYVVCVHFSKESKDTLEDKVKRLMRDDVKAANF